MPALLSGVFMRFAFVAVLLVTGLASAAQPWDAPFSDDVKGLVAAADKAPVRKDQEFQLLLDETRIDYDAQGLETFTRRMVIRVLSADVAERYAAISSDWDPWHEERPEFRARTIQPDGTVSVLDPKTVTESAARRDSDDIYSTRKTVRAPVPNVRAQTIIEREVTVREKPSLYQGRFQREVPVSNGWWAETLRVVIRAAPNLPLHVGWRGADGKAPAPTREDGFQVVRYEQSPSPAKTEWTPFLPLDRADAARLYVSIGASWAEHAKAYAEIVDQQLAASKPLAEQAKELAGKERNPVALTHRFATWMHENVRYTGLHFNEAAVVPRPPSETLERGFGDCKDLATLMVAMLRAVGVKANVALLSSSGPDTPLDAPGLTQFDHAIVYVQGKSPFFFDATAETSWAGEISPWIAGRITLVADPSLKNPLVRIPEATSADHGWKLTRTIQLAEIDAGSFESKIEERGAEAMSRRWNALHGTTEQRDAAAKSFAKNLFGCSDLVHTAIDPGDLARPTTFEVSARGCDRIVTGDHTAEVSFWLSGLVNEAPATLTGIKDDEDGDEDEDGEKKAARSVPLRWDIPFRTEGEYRIVPPPGFRTATTAESKTWKFGPASFAKSVAVGADGVVTVKAKFDSGPRTYTPAEVEAFQKGFAAAKDALLVKAQFERISSAELEAGHVVEALAELRKWTAAHPKEALHHLNYANALLSLGFGAAARDEAKRAVDADPDSVAAHRVYSYMLQHDLLGQQFAPGWDRAGAIAEYRKAIALKDDNARVKRALAHLLEVNEKGQMYGQGTSMEEAVSLYQAARKAEKNDALDMNLLIALWRSGRTKEALDLTDELPTGHGRNQIRVAALAVAKGAEAAVAELPRLATGADRDPLVAGTIAELLVMRQYPAAVQFAKRAGLPSTPQAEMQRHVLESARRAEEVKVAANDPKAALFRFFDLFAKPEGTDLKRVFAKALSPDEAATEIIVASVHRTFDSLGIPTATLRDLLYAVPGYKFEGSPQLGARVTFAGFGARDAAAYLVFEDGEWRIRTFSPDRASIAQEALTRLDRGDVAGARKWAEWAQKEAPLNEHPDAERAWRAAWPRFEELTPEKLRLALAWCVSDGVVTADRTRALETLRKATGLSEPERTAVDWAIVEAASEIDPDGTLAAIDRLQAKRSAPVLPIIRVGTLTMANRKAEAMAAVETLLTEEGEDPDLLEFAAGTATKLGDPAKARAYRQRALSTGRAPAITYNNLAWAELYTEPISLADAEQHATRANEMDEFGNASALNTLACVHAESGRGKTAHALLMKSLQVARKTEPGPYDWYVIGRIAEGYGLSDVAKDAYARASKTGKDAVDDEPTQLATRRLAAMNAPVVAKPIP